MINLFNKFKKENQSQTADSLVNMDELVNSYQTVDNTNMETSEEQGYILCFKPITDEEEIETEFELEISEIDFETLDPQNDGLIHLFVSDENEAQRIGDILSEQLSVRDNCRYIWVGVPYPNEDV
ncbi:hypothetical protein [Streptococcus dentiloxodontae]